MRVLISGEAQEVAEDTTIARLLVELELHEAAVAVAVDGEFVARSRHAERTLSEGCHVEILAPMQGG